MDCYEDMFKEITRKLYGTEDGLSSSTSTATSTPPVSSSSNTHPATSMASEQRGQRYDSDSVTPFVKTEQEVGSTLTAFGLAALMGTGFQPAVAAMHSSGYHHNTQSHYPSITPHHLPSSAAASNSSQVQVPSAPAHHHALHHQPHLVSPINIPPPPQPSAESAPGHVDRWISSDDELHWTRSKIATYNPTQRVFKCSECDFAGFLARVAEHWIGTHANLRVYQCPQCPYTSAWARCVRMHIARQHGGADVTEGDAENASSTTNPENNDNNESYNSGPPSSTSPIPSSLWKENAVLEEVTKYLQRLKTKAENIPNKPQEFSNNSSRDRGGSSAGSSDKRYCCNFCPYATDRRDLYTRHENIHRDEKPFQCYVCRKQFNRADHVKKHFLRMHRDHPYDINKIRRSPPKNASGMSYYQKYTSSASNTSTSVTTTTANTSNQAGPSRNLHHSQLPPPPPHFQQPPHHLHAPHHLQTPQHHLLQPLQTPHYGLPLRTPQPAKFQLPKTNGSASKSHKKKAPQTGMPSGPPKEQKEKRYTCCYCPWSGVDNWCLKRHLNTHIKPFVCALCDYKAARSERLATHVLKVHNKRTCNKCSFLADDQMSLTEHIHEQQ